MNEKALKLFFL